MLARGPCRLPLLLLLGALGALPLQPDTAAAQEARYRIQGRVVDARTEGPLPGVAVLIRGTNQGALTDREGAYLIAASLPTGSYTLEYSFIGRATVTRQVGLAGAREVTVQPVRLEEAAVALESIVVTAPGVEAERRALPNTVTSVAGEEIAESPGAVSIDQALQGKIPGAVISETTGQPGGGVTIRLRGVNSILGGAEPLIVVDGVIIDNNQEALVSLSANAGRGNAGITNRLADLAPEDVERVEVLKGAAAASLYGSRANNGVIQIFTKRGRQGDVRITAASEFTATEVSNRFEFNRGNANFGEVLLGLAKKAGDPVERFDIQDQVFRTGMGNTSTISVSGGGAGTAFYLSGLHTEEEGIVRNTDYDKTSVTAKLTQQLSQNFEVSGKANYIQTHANLLPEGEQTQGILTSLVFTPTSFNPNFNPNLGRFPFNPLLGPNPLEVLDRYRAPQDVRRFIGSVEGVWRPTDRFSLRYLFGLDDYTQQDMYLRPPQTESATFTGSIENPVRVSRQFNHDLVGNIDTRWRGAGWKTTLGWRYTSDQAEIVRASALDLPPGQELVGGARQFASQAFSEVRTNGGFLQQQVALRSDHLVVTGGLNLEASSAFGEDQRWQFFPRLGAAYQISEEPFWGGGPLAGAVSSLRLRAAYGQTGGQPPGAFDRFDNYVNITFASQPGLVPSILRGNPELKPERQREVEGGFDLGLFRDRVQAEFTYYNKNVEDLILSVPLPPSLGAQIQRANIGEISNKGIELALNTVNLTRGAFSWRSRLLYAANDSRVEKLVSARDTLLVGYLNVVVEGHPVGVFYGGVYARNPDGSIAYFEHRSTDARLPGCSTATPCTFLVPARAVDTLPGGRTVFHNQIIGDPNPDFTASLTNAFEFGRGLELSFLLEGRFGNDVANFSRRITEFFGSDPKADDEVTGDTIPFTRVRNPRGRINVYEEYIEDGSFVKLREVALRYRLPYGLVRRFGFGVQSAWLRVAARNLHTWTDYSGPDPEINLFSASTVAQGVDFANTPIPRSFVFGLNFVF